MIVLLVLLLLVVAGLLGYLIRESCEPPPTPPDAEGELRSAIELHRIRRRLDASWTKTEQRQDAAQLRRQISQALKEDDEP
jgi:uncharacterized membrane protein